MAMHRQKLVFRLEHKTEARGVFSYVDWEGPFDYLYRMRSPYDSTERPALRHGRGVKGGFRFAFTTMSALQRRVRECVPELRRTGIVVRVYQVKEAVRGYEQVVFSYDTAKLVRELEVDTR